MQPLADDEPVAVATLLPRRALALSAASPLFVSPATPLALQTETLTVQLRRPTTAVPLAWDETARVRVALVVTVDGVAYRHEGQSVGGLRAAGGRELAHTRLTYRPPYGYFGARTGLPKRLGETRQTTYTAHVEVERLAGSLDTEVELVATEAPAPAILFSSSIAFDAASDSADAGLDGTISHSHTAAGDDRAAFVGVSAMVSTPGSTSATYGGTGMTELWDITHGSFSINAGYRLVAPATGAQTVTNVIAEGSPFEHFMGVITLTGVDQTTPVGTPATATGTTDPITVTVGSVGATDLLCDNTSATRTTASTVGANQTERYQQGPEVDFGFEMRGSTQSGADGGVMSWTLTGTDSFGEGWGIGAVAFKEAAAGGRTTKNTRAFPLGVEIGMDWRSAA